MTQGLKRGWARPIPYGTSEDLSIVLDSASHQDFAEWDLVHCTRISNWPLDAKMSCSELQGERAADDVVPNHLGLLVVSEKCRGTMLRVVGMEDCAQFLPVKLDYIRQDIGIYYIVNILASISALERERSRYDVYTSLDEVPLRSGSIKTIRRLVLLAGRLESRVPAFRLQEASEWILFSPLMRESLESAGITGFEWWEVALSSDA